MTNGTIISPNKKGQIVIPKKIRDALGIDENTKLDLQIDHNEIIIRPIKTLSYATEFDKEELISALKEAQGSWAEDETWDDTEKKRREIELRAAEELKKPW